MKVVVSGASQCGKSNYIKFFDKNSMNVQVKGQTIAMDIAYVNFEGFQISLFGTPGLSRFRMMRDIILRGADGIVFIFDAANPKSDNDAISILNEIKNPKVPKVYLANKQDLKDARSPKMVQTQIKLSKDYKIFPSSIKTGQNIKESLKYLVSKILKKYKKLLQILCNYENDIRGLAEKLRKNKMQMRDFLYALEIRRFIKIDRVNRVYRVNEVLKKLI